MKLSELQNKFIFKTRIDLGDGQSLKSRIDRKTFNSN